MNYHTAKELYSRCRDKSKGYKWGNNRRIVAVQYLGLKQKSYGIQLHGTCVVGFTECNNVVLYTGGWWSRTTKNTMNQVLAEHGIRIFARKGDWYVDLGTRVVLFEDNMEIRLDPVRKLLLDEEIAC